MKYFKLQEIVDPATYEKYGDDSIKYFDSDAIIMIDSIREFFGVPITINNWHIGGNFK